MKALHNERTGILDLAPCDGRGAATLSIATTLRSHKESRGGTSFPFYGHCTRAPFIATPWHENSRRLLYPYYDTELPTPPDP
jgi:hypothetical protein